MIRTLVLATLVGLLAASSMAATLYVNPQSGNDAWDGRCAAWDGVTCGPKATIQAAIDAAADQDEVILAAATYTGTGNRDVSYLGKAITVRSVDPNDPAVVAATVIDCQANNNDRHRAFNFITQEGPGSVLSGVSIANGYAPVDFYYPPPYDDIVPHGGAILCRESSPTIERCAMMNNCALSGGAIYSEGGSYFYPRPGSPTISDCTFTENVVRSDAMPGGVLHGALGGAVHLDGGSPVIRRCVFEHNLAKPYGLGGAIFLTNSRAVIEKSTIHRSSCSGNGGAMYSQASHPVVVDCVISDNEASGPGGGVYAGRDEYARGGTLTLARCRIIDNGAIVLAQRSGAIAGYGTDIELVDCQVSGNQSFFEWIIRCDRALRFSGCTVTGNRVRSGALIWGATLQIDNSIIWNGTGWLDPNSTATVSYSNVQGGWAGTGNIAADPRFVDPGHWDNHGTPNDPNDDVWVPGDYHLLPGSPCIDAGDNLALPRDTLDLDDDGCTTELLPVDLAGNRRFVDDPNTPDTGHGAAPLVDMGAYEFGATAPPPPHLCPGDVNCDGVISYADINPFVAALLGEAGYTARYPDCWYLSADCNFDGVMSVADINPFVALLVQ
jgi:hypothetical protein